ncbi:GD13796 [Drosophila simulans]|uniref:GD13796 n=1 Tax=Drosophila simulans TaxID=7240 RepID=B4QQ18_DROSI|nr:GD13796 [Drosophila simulans]
MSSALNAKKLLIRAVECDQVGRILEAQTLYTEGIAQLMQFVNGEPDEAKRMGFLTRIKDLSNGYIIKIGRGLHFYKAANPMYSIGLVNYKFRKCLQTDVDIWRNSSAAS